jgi:hypothetical protein
MSKSGWKATSVPSINGVVNVARLQGYLGMLDAILGVCRQAEREGDMGSQERCKAMLADCREHVCGHLKRMDHTHQTAWEMGVADLLEGLWETMNPMPHVSDANLIGRVQKAYGMARTLEKLLSSLIVLESVSPVDVEEALERLHGADGEIPF